jgi:hypothetical protein
MAAITLSDCTVIRKQSGTGYVEYLVVTPSTADSGDTIDIASIGGITRSTGDIYGIEGFNVTDLVIEDPTVATTVITIGGSSANNKVRCYRVLLNDGM